MTVAEMVQRVKDELGRPEQDTRVSNSTILEALRDSEKSLKRRLGARDHVRRLVLEDLGSIAADDSTGATYTIPDADPSGDGDPSFTRIPNYIEVWTPPGVNKGRLLRQTMRGVLREGYYLIQNVIHLPVPRVYSPGLYVIGVFDYGQADDVTLGGSENVASSLTSSLHRAQALFAAADLGNRPFVRVDVQALMAKAERELREVIATQVFATGDNSGDNMWDTPWWNSPDLGRA